jgi:hypothetical protein
MSLPFTVGTTETVHCYLASEKTVGSSAESFVIYCKLRDSTNEKFHEKLALGDKEIDLELLLKSSGGL